MQSCGLLGEKLGHSHSPRIHKMLGSYDYCLFEKKPEEVESFLRNGEFSGLNVTIPYKKTVFAYMDEVSETAAKVGSINTIVKDVSGRLFGDNTDVYGFQKMLERAGVPVKGRKVLVLGSGGASVAVCHVLNEQGAEVTVISRSGENNYTNLDRHRDAALVVNTTPVGMYPNTGVSPLDLDVFPKLEGVLDIIYNPLRTELLLAAKKRGIAYENGLYMLVAQAKRSAERFTGAPIDDGEIDRIYETLTKELTNIVLIGMPGCGKSTVAKRLGELTGKPVYDADAYYRTKFGRTPEEEILANGEAVFRTNETAGLKELAGLSGIILSTGGGAVMREENYNILHQNGTVIRLYRDPKNLAKDHRPLSKGRPIEELAAEREPMYRHFSDATVTVTEGGGGKAEAEAILGILGGKA
ncbi:MAG: shikimate kinase [Lachnospiraceae bacterium]|nr:shikimate kinase [Lachnospiraceae bacterium]